MKIILLFLYVFLLSSTISYAQDAYTETKKWLMDDGPYKYVMEGRERPKSQQFDIFDSKTGTFRKGSAEEMSKSIEKELQEFCENERKKNEDRRDRRDRDDYKSFNVTPCSNLPLKSFSRRRAGSYKEMKYETETFSKENKTLLSEIKGYKKISLKGINKKEKKNEIGLKGMNSRAIRLDRKIDCNADQKITPSYAVKRNVWTVKQEKNIPNRPLSVIMPQKTVKYAREKGDYFQQMWNMNDEDGFWRDEVENNSLNRIKKLPVQQLIKEIKLNISDSYMGQTIINLKEKIERAKDIKGTEESIITRITDYIANNAVNDIDHGNDQNINRILYHRVINDVDNLIDRNVPGYVKMTYTREDAGKKTSDLFFKFLGL